MKKEARREPDGTRGTGVSILHDVLGPVMRGPSSSHTAAAHRIAVLARSLLGASPALARFAFHPRGSYGRVFSEQGADLSFACGLLGWELTDPRFHGALEEARRRGLEIEFALEDLPRPDHPNTVDASLRDGEGRSLRIRARSVGGGMVEITSLEDWPVLLRGEAWEVLVECAVEETSKVEEILGPEGTLGPPERRGGRALVRRARRVSPAEDTKDRILELPGVTRLWEAPPLFPPRKGAGLFSSSGEMAALAGKEGLSLGELALLHEADLLGLPEKEVLDEVERRLGVMEEAVRLGLGPEPPSMQLLSPSAGKIFRAEREGSLALGGPQTRAAARALAAMHVNSGMGVVCAAPTGGAAGVLPGVLVTLLEDLGSPREKAALAFLAAGAVGVVIASRATFAAEIAGCQVEIGAAGAMAAAAVVEWAGGGAGMCADAAAVSLQNTMGSVCDLVQGVVEIPCHTRNAAAAASAFVCADLILGGYRNPVPLDETVDAVLATGKMLPSALRCTARGGLAAAPSARALPRRLPGRRKTGRAWGEE